VTASRRRYPQTILHEVDHFDFRDSAEFCCSSSCMHRLLDVLPLSRDEPSSCQRTFCWSASPASQSGQYRDALAARFGGHEVLLESLRARESCWRGA